MNEDRDLSASSEAPVVNGHAKEPQPLPNEYRLSGPERAALQKLNIEIGNAKMAVYNSNAQLEEALEAVRAAEARWSGALGMLAVAKGMENARLDPDMTKLTRT